MQLVPALRGHLFGAAGGPPAGGYAAVGRATRRLRTAPSAHWAARKRGVLPGRCLLGVKLLAVAFLALVCTRPAGAQRQLFEQDPFDRITLDENNDHAVLKVKPLDLPDRRVPDPLPRRGQLQIRLLDAPARLYRVPWRAIDKVELFEQLVLKEAGALVAAEKFDEAYDYFQFLEGRHPQLAGLDEAIEEYLFQEARALYAQGRYDGALALLRELYRRNPKRPKLEAVLGTTTDKLVEGYIAKGDYRSARALLRNLAAWFPEHPIVVGREGELKQQAAALLAEARAAVEDGDLRRAAGLTDRVISLWPALPGARDLAESVHRKYPRVVVGVTLPAAGPRPGGLHDWAACRSGRLIYRTLTEFVGPSGEGGQYRCPVGQMTLEPLERRITFQIRPGLRWSASQATLSGYDVSRRLLAMADAGDPAYRADWAGLLRGVAARGVYRVDAQLRFDHVRPDALLQTTLVPYTSLEAPNRPPPANGPYLLTSQTQRQTRYRANASYFASRPGQPKEIVERHYTRGARAIRALQHGRAHVLDRVNPWSWDTVRREKGLVLRPYAMPWVHCLVPNRRRPLTAHRAFRRALVYGIHRRVILDQLLGGELERSAADGATGCRVLSGPFPARASFDDPISYARDPTIEPRAYHPRLAIALAETSRREVAAAGDQDHAGKPPATIPRLVLAHPPHEPARLACTAIQRQLRLVGIPIELKEHAGPPPAQIPEDVDLLYAEVAMWEPVVDARRLLGEDGLAGRCSPYMSLALRQLDHAADWQHVRQILQRIHRIAHDEVAVVPLWQLTEHFAYHKNLTGIGARPASLYQNVEQWECAFQYPGN